jgi:FdhD protein
MRGETEGREFRAILLHDGKALVESEAPIIREIPLEIHLNGRRVVTIACTGIHVEELAAGFLRSEGLLRNREEIKRLTVSPDRTRVWIVSSTITECPDPESGSGRTIASSGARSGGRTGADYPPDEGTESIRLSPERIFLLMEQFLAIAGLHEETGGTHAAALVLGGEIRVVREDIGRHNAVDMLGGHALLNGLDCRGAVIFRTGRVSSEIVHKVRQLGIRMIVSLSVPTTVAVDVAKEAGITLVGSVRGGRMKIYSHEGRVSH